MAARLVTMATISPTVLLSAVGVAIIFGGYILGLFTNPKKLCLPIATLKPGNISDSLMEARATVCKQLILSHSN